MTFILVDHIITTYLLVSQYIPDSASTPIAEIKQMSHIINGIDTQAMQNLASEIAAAPEKGAALFGVRTTWCGKCRSESRPTTMRLGGVSHDRKGMAVVDEPQTLLGDDTGLNPMEMLMTALNGCMTVGYVAGAAARGITLTKLEIKTEGELDLRGFFGLDPLVKPGFDTLRYSVHISGDGTPEQFEEIHQSVMRLSPNRFNVSMPVRLEPTLCIE
ncbi:OsmC family protein [Iodidimonas gelatinilytica]|uniref:OsmC family protein n=1 Tax=Iodidimonas gelatinilytica TaxID=1236966 RepID=UPI001B2FF913|nr:OsmC family protein [Iodidimonas gelatinilytica]